VWYTGKPIPTNLITGFLGTGKTTAIRALLNHRPQGERWSVFVNEYGMVSIDDVMFDQKTSDVQIQELAGGCFCCTTAGMLDTVLMQFIRRTKPDRLIIEPSGAGHPARVIDTLRGDRFRDAIDLRATICLVDPKDFENPRVTNTDGFHDQIQMSDVVAINWIDKRDPAQVERCRQWITHFDPPKLLVAETQFGMLNPAWLDLDGTAVRLPRLTDPHAAHHHHHSDGVQPEIVRLNEPARPGRPVRLANEGNGQRACGWIFAAEDQFHRDELFDYLGSIQKIQRIKGVFRCDDDWWLINRTGSDVSITCSAYRHDSRLEVITDDAELNWSELEAGLVSALMTQSDSEV
jgi:G3E family GTPase